MPGSAADKLAKYRAKRSQTATPEPFGGDRAHLGGLFVVQKHAARRTHFDLRIELDGVLKSWAVPRGPSLDPDEKRFAVETEDHPLEYGDFEGVIPDGNYGAGGMIVWDRGRWIALEDPVAGFKSGKLLFELRGHKLRGVWTIFRTKPPAIHRGKTKDEGKQWLLVKKPDEAARPGDDPPLDETSVLSGLTVEELRDGAEKFDEVLANLDESSVPEEPVDAREIPLTLATAEQAIPSYKGWIYELKYDGYRLVVAKRGGKPFLRYRNGHEATHLFPEIVRCVASLPIDDFVLDGEVVILDPSGRPSFSRLQQRALLSKAVDIKRAAIQHPATCFVFDLLGLGPFDLRGLPLIERKAHLERICPRQGSLRYCEHITENGEAFFRQIEKMSLEGMVSKEAKSTYVGQRTKSWLKHRVDRSGDFVIVGWSAGKNRPDVIGALHVAVREGDEWLYVGRVGTGFSDKVLDELKEALTPLEIGECVCTGVLPSGPKHHWTEPSVVCEVRFKEITPQGMLRHPVFLRLRDDKNPIECTLELPTEEREAPPQPAQPEVENPVTLTNLDKVFWPTEGYTKGDLIDFYGTIAPAMLPFLDDRPVVLTRYPDGIDGKSFFQKNAPDFAPDWIRTTTIYSEGSEREIEYFLCDSKESLVYLANLGAIVLHVWSSRTHALGEPDWCILDLDPKEAPFSDVVDVAKAIRKLCKAIDLECFVKTSGSTGLHILLPLGGQCSYQQSRTLGGLIAQVISRQLPEISTIVRNPNRRDGKVYIDFGQNGHGRLLVAPYSVRPLPEAPVSTPLRWSEVNHRLDLRDHNIKSVPKRTARQKTNPLSGVLETKPDLIQVLTRLSELGD